MVERCGQWADYSPRNQVLLASYGVVGPVAGTATWERVPSTEEGRPCAPRTGEHGLPIRVPVTAEGTTYTQRSRLPARSGSIAAGHRWDLVYAAEQLARRPAPGALSPPAVPALTPAEWNEVVRHGRRPDARAAPLDGSTTPTVTSRCWPPRHRSGPAGPRSATRRCSARWPGWSPTGSGWRRARCRRSTRRRCRRGSGGRPSSTCAPRPIGSPGPCRTASGSTSRPARCPGSTPPTTARSAPTRRNYLSPADVRGLPIGVWVESGPYTRAEWLARGVAGADRPSRPSAGQRPFLPRRLRGPLGSDVATRDHRPRRPSRPGRRRHRRVVRRRQGGRPRGAARPVPRRRPRRRRRPCRRRSRRTTAGCRCPAAATTAPRAGCSTSGCRR